MLKKVAIFPEANRLTVHILAAVAEHEAQMISECTKAVLAAAKARGVKLGGTGDNLSSVCRQGAQASAKVRSEQAKKRAEDLRPVIAELRNKGVKALRGIADELNASGYQAPRGGSWNPASVARILA